MEAAQSRGCFEDCAEEAEVIRCIGVGRAARDDLALVAAALGRCKGGC